jgi:hypothetical protein
LLERDLRQQIPKLAHSQETVVYRTRPCRQDCQKRRRGAMAESDRTGGFGARCPQKTCLSWNIKKSLFAGDGGRLYTILIHLRSFRAPCETRALCEPVAAGRPVTTAGMRVVSDRSSGGMIG